MTGELGRLRQIMAQLRAECPWDAEQTHSSLLTHLVEETAEVIDAVELGDDDDLREELGDLLLQVYFHAQIAADEGRFDLDDVASGIAEKLIRRHPHVFAGEDVPDDMWQSWEERKRAEKGRTSALEGIAESLNVLPRMQKVMSRSRSHRVALDLSDEPIDEATFGAALVSLVARAQASGLDADAVARRALRSLEARVVDAENPA